MGKLSALAVKNATATGKARYIGDGRGLWLQVTPSGAKSWIFRYTRDGKAREMGLGATHTISLAEARELALECRKKLQNGGDPLAEREAARLAAKLEAAKAMTFDQCAAAYIDAHRPGWKNAKHASQWVNTLATYAAPIIGKLPVAAIDTPLVMKIIEPIWQTKAETAARLRGRLEQILDWATVRQLRQGENPARLRGHLDKLLAKRLKSSRGHHAALPYDQIGDFMADLRKQEGVAAKALEFLILTAARTGEVIGAQWDEFDLGAALWVVPAERMKAKKEHRVPLSARALEILAALHDEGAEGFVFQGRRKGQPLSNMALLMALRRMGRGDLTAHGFRSTFRDWAAESTAFPHEVAEMALAHTVGNKVEAAYRRGDLYQKRVGIMRDWAKRCDQPDAAPGTVTAIRGRKGAPK
jgi:integrase